VPALNESRGAVARGATFGLAAQFVDKLLPVLIFLYLARALGAEEFGQYSFLIAYLALFQIVPEQSIDTVLVRTLTQNPDNKARVFRATLSLRVAMALTGAVIMTAFVAPVSGGRTDVLLAAAAASGLLTAMGGAYRSYFRAELDIRAVLYIASLRAVLLALGVLIAMAVAPGVLSVFISVAVANGLNTVIVAIVSRHRVAFGLAYSPEIWRQVATGAIPLALNALAITVSLRVGQILLMSMRGPVDVGLLGAAARVSDAFTLLPEALMVAIYPIMTGLHTSDQTRLLATAQRSVRYLLLPTGLGVVFCMLAGDLLMGTLFGENFADAGPALGILSALALFGATGTVIVNLLVAVHREKALSRNTMVFAAITVALSIPAIERWGFVGAAVVTVGTSVASQLSLALLTSTGPYVRACLAAALRPIAAVAIAAAVGSAIGSVPMALGLGGVVYCTVVVATGAVTREDIAFARAMMPKRG
jgi:O-antigen/teichoic acid export membrane protein